MLQFLDKKRPSRRTRSEELPEKEELKANEHERLKAMFIKSSKRRNAICKVMMPRQFFDSLPYFELLDTLSRSGLT